MELLYLRDFQIMLLTNTHLMLPQQCPVIFVPKDPLSFEWHQFQFIQPNTCMPYILLYEWVKRSIDLPLLIPVTCFVKPYLGYYGHFSRAMHCGADEDIFFARSDISTTISYIIQNLECMLSQQHTCFGSDIGLRSSTIW